MDISRLKGKSVLVTGASGLIGRDIVARLLSYDLEQPITVYALVRNELKARKAFEGLHKDNLRYIVCDVCNLKIEDMGVDYIIHCASHTASKDFIDSPVDVITDIFAGAENILKFAKVNNARGLVYLSTMEVYGSPTIEHKVYETSASYLDVMQARSSYPEAKRACECLCAAYASQYGVNAKVVRLTQTFGRGVSYNDKRVFAEFARCVIEGRDIVLKTKGETMRNYLSTDDATDAILTVLLDGKAGEAYNAANEDTYCSIYDMARLVADNFGTGKVSVRIEEQDISLFGYAPTLKMDLSSAKLAALGWKARKGLKEMFAETIEDMRKQVAN
ncbi:MAG: NAD(P)-dependent oxidoreductase [Clostridia bacterium]|nr:NAD(P)-dependent oxidoreductase [Clostridia bacterium]